MRSLTSIWRSCFETRGIPRTSRTVHVVDMKTCFFYCVLYSSSGRLQLNFHTIMDVIKCRSTKTMHLFPNPKAHDARPGCPKHRVRDAWAMENGANYEVLAAPANPSSHRNLGCHWTRRQNRCRAQKKQRKKKASFFRHHRYSSTLRPFSFPSPIPVLQPAARPPFWGPGLCEFQASPAPPAETGSRPLADEGTPRCRDDRRSRGVTRSKSGELGHGIAQHGFLLMRAASAGSGM